MAKFNHKFWEISVAPHVLESALEQPDFLTKLLTDRDGDEAAELRESRTKEIFQQVQEIIDTRLTEKQRQIVEMYFFQNKTQAEIAEALGVPQQVVSKHLFGVIREGHKIGGAIAKIKKHCNKLGIDIKKWV